MRAITYGCGMSINPTHLYILPCRCSAPPLCKAPSPYCIKSIPAAVNFPLRVSTSPPDPVVYALPCESSSSVLLGSVGSSQVLVAALGPIWRLEKEHRRWKVLVNFTLSLGLNKCRSIVEARIQTHSTATLDKLLYALVEETLKHSMVVST